MPPHPKFIDKAISEHLGLFSLRMSSEHGDWGDTTDNGSELVRSLHQLVPLILKRLVKSPTSW